MEKENLSYLDIVRTAKYKEDIIVHVKPLLINCKYAILGNNFHMYFCCSQNITAIVYQGREKLVFFKNNPPGFFVFF